MDQRIKRFDVPIVVGLSIGGAIFLLELAYLRIWFSLPIIIAYLAALYIYVKARFGLKIPLVFLIFVSVSVALDGLGNLFPLYTTRYKYVQYDEFTHTVVPALTVPLIVWFFRAVLNRTSYRLPLGLVTFFAFTTMFTFCGAYEVVELWDDKYRWPEPGMRIHGPYDTARDLQFNFIGMAIGGLIAYAILRRQEKISDSVAQPARLSPES